MPADLIERYFSRAFFPAVQPVITALSNRAPFALFDVLLIGVMLWWLIAALIDVAVRRPRRSPSPVISIALRTITAASVTYLLFLALWGFNYRRVPLRDQVRFEPRRISAPAARALVARSVARVNALHDEAHAEVRSASGVIDPVLAQAFAATEHELGVGNATLPARPKATLLDFYFRRAAVAGMTDPFLLETLIATDLLPMERPFVVAHEWSHLAGFANESEANFVGWLTCLRGSPLHQYSGWLFLYGEAASSLGTDDLRAESASLAPGPRADLRAIRDRLERHVNPRVSAAGWQVYDRYLKANRIEEGAASYGEVVTLVLGTEFDAEGRPVLRR